jgi:protein-S-isoprenylcysteine O-methyltransferase Ste14
MEPRHAPILVVIPPPVQYALSFLAGVVLDRLMPWRLAWMTMEGVHWVGAALAVVGFILAVASAGGFVHRGTTLNPAGQPAHLIATGAHAWSRNPMYLSLTIICAGTALALGKSLAVGLGGSAVGGHELDCDSLRGSAPSKSLWPRLCRLLSDGSALALALSGSRSHTKRN